MSKQRMTDKPDGKRWGIAVAGLLALYMGAYYALVHPAIYEGFLPHPRTVEYRWGGDLTETIFAPAHFIDANLIRSGFWHEEF